MMKFFYSPASPFARKVHMTLLLSGLMDQCEKISTNFESAELREQNPLGKIPALVDGNTKLFESQIICEYLCDKANSAGTTHIDLFQRNSEHYFDVQSAYAVANGITEAAVATIMESHRTTEQSEHWLKRWETAMTSGIQYSDVKYLGSASHPNIASLAMIAALGYIEFRLSDFDWQTLNNELAQWYREIKKESWVKASSPS